MLPPIASLLTSTVDHPGSVSLVIFLPYCNLNCFACHNRELVEGRVEFLPTERLLWELENNFLFDLIVITGGEPVLHGKSLLELIDLIRRERGDVPIRVDSNGSLPDLLELVAGSVDGFAIDVKAPPSRREEYELVVGRSFNAEDLIRSVEIAAELPYTIFRTVRYPWLTEVEIEEIRRFLAVHGKGRPHFVNPYFDPRDSGPTSRFLKESARA